MHYHCYGTFGNDVVYLLNWISRDNQAVSVSCTKQYEVFLDYTQEIRVSQLLLSRLILLLIEALARPFRHACLF